MKNKADPPMKDIQPASERNAMIFTLRESGESIKNIATRFNISTSRVDQICQQIKFMKENYDKWPLLRKRLSNRTKGILRAVFGESIFENPDILVKIGSQDLLKIKNLGRYTLKEISSVLLDMELINTKHHW